VWFEEARLRICVTDTERARVISEIDFLDQENHYPGKDLSRTVLNEASTSESKAMNTLRWSQGRKKTEFDCATTQKGFLTSRSIIVSSSFLSALIEF
jgi:hypothetical protein